MPLQHSSSENSESNSRSDATAQTPWQHTPPQTSPSEPARLTPRFEPSEVERIIARASALQETHQKTLSPDQIEAIAAEVGIAPEFVQLAMAHEENGVFAEQSESVYDEETVVPLTTGRIAAVSLGVILLYGFLARFLLHIADNSLSHPLFVSTVFLFPALIVFGLGAWGRSRRWGAISGLALGLAIVAVVLNSYSLFLPVKLTVQDLQALVITFGGNALLGAAGAQARRVVSRRLVKNRGRRRSTVARRAAL